MTRVAKPESCPFCAGPITEESLSMAVALRLNTSFKEELKKQISGRVFN